MPNVSAHERGKAAYAAGRYLEANDEYAIAVEEMANSGASFLEKLACAADQGRTLRRLGRYENAESALKAALDSLPAQQYGLRHL